MSLFCFTTVITCRLCKDHSTQLSLRFVLINVFNFTVFISIRAPTSTVYEIHDTGDVIRAMHFVYVLLYIAGGTDCLLSAR